MFIEWREEFALGIPAIDQEHIQLVDGLNHFFARTQSGASAEELNRILKSLYDDLSKHFAHEELLLDQADVPDVATHIAEHRRLLQDLRYFREPYEKAEQPRELTMDTAQLLRSWILDHILEMDMRCKPYLRRIA